MRDLPRVIRQHLDTLDAIELEWRKDRQRIQNQADVIETYQNERARDALGGQAALDEANNAVNSLREQKATLERMNTNQSLRIENLTARNEQLCTRNAELDFDLRRFYGARDAIATANALLQEALRKEGGK